MEREFLEVEGDLIAKEGELRQYAKKEADGLLSAKVTQIRNDVEEGRQKLRELEQAREDQQAYRERLEIDLKNTECMERRRNEVALETEQNLAKVKSDLSRCKAELDFLSRNKEDLELALRATQEEKSIVERELFALRSQLQLKAQGTIFSIAPLSNSKQSTMRDRVTSPLRTIMTGQFAEQVDSGRPEINFPYNRDLYV